MSVTLNQRWAAHLLGALVAGGVRHVVLAPGSRSTPLALALADRADVRCWPVIDERVAGFFALGLAKGAGAPVAVVCTSGSAGAHLLPAVIEAREGATPLVVVTADRPHELHGFGAAQTIDQGGLFGRFVQAELQLAVPEDVPAAWRHLAVRVVQSLGQGGPVHINAPFREPLAPEREAVGPVVDPPVPGFSSRRRQPDVSAVVSLLAQSRRGVIVCGPRERDDGFGAAVHRLGVHLGYPVLAEAASNARYGHDEAVALYDAVWRSPAGPQFAPDLVLRFGGGLTAKSMISLGAAELVVFAEDERLFDPNLVATQVVLGDAVAACEALLQAPAGEQAWRARWAAVEGRLRARLAEHQALDEPTVARDVVASLGAGTNLVVSSSMPIRDVDGFAPTAVGPLRVFSNRGVNGIDGVTSTALGVAAASGRATTLLIGDVALLHDVGAWVAAKTLGVPLVVVAVNNDGGGIFSFLPVAERTSHFERLFGMPHGVDLAHVAGLAGARLHRPTSLGQLRATIADVHRAGGVHLVEVRSERGANVATHRALLATLAEVVS